MSEYKSSQEEVSHLKYMQLISVCDSSFVVKLESWFSLNRIDCRDWKTKIDLLNLAVNFNLDKLDSVLEATTTIQQGTRLSLVEAFTQLTNIQRTHSLLFEKYDEYLRHMLGAESHYKKKQYGFRNRYCASIDSQAYKDMLEMEQLGLVKQGPKINNDRDQYFAATKKGCEAIKLSKAAIKRAFDE